MSTNYYFHAEAPIDQDDELEDDDSKEGLHVGLRAGGLFRFHAHPCLGLNSFQDWMRFMAQPGVLVDEYGHTVVLAEFRDMVDQMRDDAIRGPARAEYLNAPQLEGDQKYVSGSRYRDAEGFLLNDYEFS